MNKTIGRLFIPFAAVILLIACRKEKSCDGCINGNKPPVSVAGPDQVVTLPTDSILLDGSGSRDPDGTISKWLWKKISGPASFSIVSETIAKTMVRSLDTGVYYFELTVEDNGGLYAKDTTRVTVNSVTTANRPPIARAGPDQTINLPTNTIAADGGASIDPDNNITTYLWTKISGPASYNITNAGAIQTHITNLVLGTYQFELKITDAGGLSGKDTLQVTVNPLPLPTCAPLSRPLITAQLTPYINLPITGGYHTCVAAGNKLIFAGGLSSGGNYTRVDIYDLSTQGWTQTELSIGRSSLASIVAGNKVFFAGGQTDFSSSVSSRVDIYDLANQTWTVAELSQARGDIAAAVVGDKVFFAGGYRDVLNASLPSSRVDIYNLSTQSWSTTELSEARGLITPVSTESKVYFAGGDPVNVVNHNGSDRIDIFDNLTGTWSISNLNEGKAFFAGIYKSGRIFWAGGANEIGPGASETYSCKVEIRDSNTQSSSLTNLFETKQYIKAYGKGNKIAFLKHTAAWDFQANSPWNFDIYDVVSNTWAIGTVSQPPLIWPTHWISHDNTIYLIGMNQLWKLEF